MSILSQVHCSSIMSSRSGSEVLNGSLADPEKAHRQRSYVGTCKSREEIKAGFLQVLGPNQQRLSTEGGITKEKLNHIN